jgi:hypothetical protein
LSESLHLLSQALQLTRESLFKDNALRISETAMM